MEDLDIYSDNDKNKFFIKINNKNWYICKDKMNIFFLYTRQNEYLNLKGICFEIWVKNTIY